MDGDRPRIYIHAGTPKTATTMLQQHLFAQHPQVRFLGKYENSHRLGFRDEVVRKAMSSVSDSKALDERDMTSLRSMADRAVVDNKSLVISEENFASRTIPYSRRRAERFRDIFSSARVLFVIREPFEFLESHYFQHLKGYNLKHSPYRSLKEKLQIEPPHYFDMNRWMGAIWDRHQRSHLSVVDKANLYAEIFGRENVKIMNFDLLKSDFRRFVFELSEWFDLDPEISLELCSGKRSNDRWTERDVQRLQQLERWFWQRRAYRRCQKAKERLAMLRGDNKTSVSDSPKAQGELSPYWRGVVEEFVSEKLDLLEKDWGIIFANRRVEADRSTISLPTQGASNPVRKIA